MSQKVSLENCLQLEEDFGAHNYHPLDVVITRGEGVWLYDLEGNQYLDCLSAYSAVNQGHCHPALVRVLQEQGSRLTLTSRAFRNDQLPFLYQALHELSGKDMALPMNSGAEAVETAIKAARRWGYRMKGIPPEQAEIVVCAGNFHGRTVTIVGFSTEEQYREGFGPFTQGFKIIPYGDLEALRQAINRHTCAFLVEPIQGEAGIRIPPAGFMREAAAICRQERVLLVADEIQTGLGRTGRMFACDHEDVIPDIYIIGKALAGGFYPVSAILADREIMEVFSPGDHGSTFGGNPLGAALAREALRILVEERLPQRAQEMGAYFMDKLNTLSHPHIKQIRGRGLLIGMELEVPARPYCERLKDAGILCKETHTHVIRFAPPLVIDRQTLDWAFLKIRDAFTD